MFVMISGALFLNPEKNIPIRKLYTKYIFRIVTAFAFWSLVYMFLGGMKNINAISFIENFLSGSYHMWFMYLIIGLYMIVPFVRKIAHSEDLTKYFFVLALIFTFILPETAKGMSLFSERYREFLSGRIDALNLYFIAGHTCYFLLGYFLDRVHISSKIERMIYFAGIAGTIIIPLASGYISVLRNKPTGVFGSFSVTVLCESAALFIFFRKYFNWESKAIRNLSQYSFGAYLVHPAIIAAFNNLGLNTLTFNPVLSVPVISVIVFIISSGISAVLNHIPVLKKYIV